MRNLKDIIVERLVISKTKQIEKPTEDQFNQACLDYIQRVQRGYSSFEICINKLPSYSQYTNLVDMDKLPLIDVSKKLTDRFIRCEGEAYLRSVQYDDVDGNDLPIRIYYVNKHEFDTTDISKRGIQIHKVDIYLDKLIDALDAETCVELYDYICNAQR